MRSKLYTPILSRMHSLNLKPDFKFRRHLDPPWDNGLGTAMKATSALILLNTVLILTLGIIGAASVDLSSDRRKADSSYIDDHVMLLHAELIFFYMTIPLVYVATNFTENWVLWEDRLRPLYVISAAVIAINVWILQLTVWGPCMFASSSGKGADGPGYCPYLFRDRRVDLNELQTVGSPRMVFYSVPSVFILYVRPPPLRVRYQADEGDRYIAYLAFGIIAFRRERRRPQKTDSFDLDKSHTYPSQGSDAESVPFRNSWRSRNSPPKTSPDTESLMSPKTREPNADDKDDGETMTAAPAIALMLTTPHGTTEQQDPFDDDRSSRLGFRTH